MESEIQRLTICKLKFQNSKCKKQESGISDSGIWNLKFKKQESGIQ